jgi:hypothetical protein
LTIAWASIDANQNHPSYDLPKDGLKVELLLAALRNRWFRRAHHCSLIRCRNLLSRHSLLPNPQKIALSRKTIKKKSRKKIQVPCFAYPITVRQRTRTVVEEAQEVPAPVVPAVVEEAQAELAPVVLAAD